MELARLEIRHIPWGKRGIGNVRTDHGKGLEPPNQLVLDMLRRVWVVVRQQGVLEERDLVLGRVEGLEFGLGYPLVVIEDRNLDWRRHVHSHTLLAASRWSGRISGRRREFVKAKVADSLYVCSSGSHSRLTAADKRPNSGRPVHQCRHCHCRPFLPRTVALD